MVHAAPARRARVDFNNEPRPSALTTTEVFPKVNDQQPWRYRIATWPLSAGLALLAAAGVARADIDFNPQARVSADHNSNVFQRPTDEPPFAATGNTQLGDTLMRYLAGATADLSWGLDHLKLNAQGERFDYDRFDGLNHY
jgi:hypothetical protein